jgi:hypothetical protein
MAARIPLQSLRDRIPEIALTVASGSANANSIILHDFPLTPTPSTSYD